jgi:hypothetical protein
VLAHTFFPKALEIKKAARCDPAPLDGVVKHAFGGYSIMYFKPT